MKLPEYIMQHSFLSPTVGADVIFFKVAATSHANKVELEAAIREHSGEFCHCNPFDGKEHNYLELGGWIGDQGLALRLIGLGSELGMWNLLTPRTVLGDLIDDNIVQRMAGMGMISLQCNADK